MLSAQALYSNAPGLPLPGSRRQSMDVIAVDIDKDGDLDIILANEFQANVILVNDGNANFTDVSSVRLPQVVHDSEDIVMADFDQDNDLDLIFVSEDDSVHEYYLNDGNGSFLNDVSNRLPPSICNAVASADLNGDLYPDLLLGNAGQNILLINDSTGGFWDETNTRLPAIIDITQDVKFQDVDGDGDLDIFAGNENGNRLLINTGNGVFLDSTFQKIPDLIFLNLETRKVEFGDVDGDNDQDLFLSNVNFISGKDNRDRLFINDGHGNFRDSSLTKLPMNSGGTLDGIFTDIEPDGDLDLVGCKFPTLAQFVWVNDGQGNFTDATLATLDTLPLMSGLGVVAADFDGDSLNDLYICDRGWQDYLYLRNDSLVGVAPEALGSYLKVWPNPARDVLNIQWNTDKIPMEGASLLIFSSSGKLVRKVQFLNNEKSIKISLTSSGILFYRLMKASGKELARGKILQY